MQTVYCEHVGDEPHLEEKDSTFTLTSRDTTITLTEDNYNGENDAITEYLEQFGRTPIKIFYCNYCDQIPNKSPTVGFLVDVENTENASDFVRLRFEDDKFAWDKTQHDLPEESLLSVTGYV